MLQQVIRFLEFSEIIEFNESSVPSKKNSNEGHLLTITRQMPIKDSNENKYTQKLKFYSLVRIFPGITENHKN